MSNRNKKKRGAKKLTKKTVNQPIRQSKINPKRFIKKAIKQPEDIYVSERCFDDMPLSPLFKGNLARKGYVLPTEIQDKALEFILNKRDVLGIAQTGTGKTGAFLIPLIERNLKLKRKPFVLIVVPTRELAVQIDKEFKSITKSLKLYSLTLVGGTNINKDVQNLRRLPHFIIGTPRRILELLKIKALDLREVNTLVLDEFDRMLDMGFLPAIERITGAMHRRQHTLLFSATLPKKQLPLIREILYNPVTIKLSKSTTTGDHIEQDVIYFSNDTDRFNRLLKLISDNTDEKILLFEDTKINVEQLYNQLTEQGIKTYKIHGGMLQKERTENFNGFSESNNGVLIATDIASRGIDISDISLVVNYRAPLSFNDYIHRIGRTGRSGKQGKAFTFIPR